MTTPESMKAAFIRETGGPELIRFDDLPSPEPGPTDVLVRLEASEVNHVDLFVRSGAYQTSTPFPFVIGRDLVGTVERMGPSVTGLSPGDRVWTNSMGVDGRQGTWAEFSVVPSDRLYRLPEGVDPQHAAAVLHGAATAHVGLFRGAGLRPGETLFVGGAAGAVGTSLVQMASAFGVRVIATASPRDHDWCIRCGAEAVFDYHSGSLPEELRDAAPSGYDVWWDTSGHHDFKMCLPLMRPGGSVVVMSGIATTTKLPVGELYTRDISLRGFAISNASVDDLAAAARTINSLLARGVLKTPIGKVLGLEQAPKAHQLMADRTVSGRIVIRP